MPRKLSTNWKKTANNLKKHVHWNERSASLGGDN